jgi:predicted MFS family arabinose efflux permease
MGVESATLTASREHSRGYRYFVLAILIVVYTFNFIDRVIISILATPIKAELGLTDTQLGALSGIAFAAFYTLLGIPIAILADRWNRTWIMTVALALWSGFTALCGVAQSYLQLVASRVGVGVGEAGGVAPAYALVSDYFPPAQRARALAVFSFGIPIGSGLGILFGGLMASAVNWRTAFIAVGMAGLVLVPIFRLCVREPVRGGLDARAKPLASASVLAVLRALGTKPSFWALSFGASASSIVGYGVIFWLPSFFIRSFELSLRDTSLFLGIGTIVFGTLGMWLGGWLGDRLGARSKAAYALVPATMFVCIVPFFVAGTLSASVYLSLAMFAVPIGLGIVWIGPVVTAIQHLVVPGMRATASAIFLFINNLIGIGGGTLFVGRASDLLLEKYGSESLRYGLLAASVFYGVAAILLYVASRRLERDWERT